MTINEAVEQINIQMDEILEENEEALPLETENEIKSRLVNHCDLEEYFKEQDLEDIYLYEIFEEIQGKVEDKKLVQVVQTWILLLEELADIELDIVVSDIGID